jgi:hypothetical protein
VRPIWPINQANFRRLSKQLCAGGTISIAGIGTNRAQLIGRAPHIM